MSRACAASGSYLREEVGLLESPPEPPASVAFLAPLDPFVWDRALLRPLYDFDYLWEVYVPEAKRRWGYYVLPVLFRDRLVGRIEPRIDRADWQVQRARRLVGGRLRAAACRGFVEAMRAALRAYLRFAGASRIEWAPHLGKEKRLFLDTAVTASTDAVVTIPSTLRASSASRVTNASAWS